MNFSVSPVFYINFFITGFQKGLILNFMFVSTFLELFGVRLIRAPYRMVPISVSVNI